MDQDFFKHLPREISINILSRLPVRSVVCCKCVHKAWLELIETEEFIISHVSKSVPGLLVFEHSSKLHKIMEFEDAPDLKSSELHYKLVAKANLPYQGKIHGSVNGLLLLHEKKITPEELFICNPITRDYVKILCPPEDVHPDSHFVTFGFGASKITGQHKVVRICQDTIREANGMLKISVPEWAVYTLGTGSWRKIEATGPSFMYGDLSFRPGNLTSGAFLDGSIYWPACDLNGVAQISSFDLETEGFASCNSPLPSRGSVGQVIVALCTLGDSLCLCDITSDENIVIWLGKDCGAEMNWTKLVIRKSPEFFPFRFMFGLISVRKVFKNGDILMEWDGSFLFNYNRKKSKKKQFDMIHYWREGTVYTPSFLSLKAFKRENVRTF